MRNLRSLAVLFVASCSAPGAAEPFPVSNAKYFPQGEVDVAFVDRLVALRGEVEAIEAGPLGKPLFKLNLAGVATSVWVGSLVAVENPGLERRSTVKVLGYLRRVTDGDSTITAVTEDKYFVLGFCLLAEATQKAHYAAAGIRQCERWQAGETAEELMP